MKHAKSCFLTAALLAFCAHGAAAQGPSSTPPRRCADLPATSLPCRFDFSQYRFSDPQLDLPGTGPVLLVHSAAEFNRAARNVTAGQQIVLADGEWHDAALQLRGQGVEGRPIVIRPQSADGVRLTGSSSLGVAGSHIAISGLSFEKGNFSTDGFAALRLGLGAKAPCDRCTLNHVSIAGYDPAPAAANTIRSYYVIAQGRGISLANSSFTTKHSAGAYLLANHPANVGFCAGQACHQDLLVLNNVFSGMAHGSQPDSEDGKYEVMQIGGSDGSQAAFTVISGNIFRDNDGSTPMVAVKTSDIIIEGNQFQSNSGGLTLREGNRILVANNRFEAGARPGMGGIVVTSQDNWIVRNSFRGMASPPDYYHWPINLPAAGSESLEGSEKDFTRARNILIAENTFENSVSPAIALGVYPRPDLGRHLLPSDIMVTGNLFSRPSTLPHKQVTAQGQIGFIGDPAGFTNIHQANNQAR